MLTILYEDEDIIVPVKPAGLQSQSVHSFEPDMVSEIRKHIAGLSTKMSTNLPEPYVGVIHRLDKPVGGVMVYAKNQKATAALSKQIQDGTLKKTYCAVICGQPVDNVGKYVDFLRKDEKNNYSQIVDKSVDGSKRAELSYEVLGTKQVDGQKFSLVKIQLMTGRHHQISRPVCRTWFSAFRRREIWKRFKRNTGRAQAGTAGIVGDGGKASPSGNRRSYDFFGKPSRARIFRNF